MIGSSEGTKSGSTGRITVSLRLAFILNRSQTLEVFGPDFSKDKFSGITRTSEAKSLKKTYNEAELEIDMHAKRVELILFNGTRH